MDGAPTFGGRQRGAPTGDAAPDRDERRPDPEDPLRGGFACEFPGCERGFTTKTGRGVHYRRTHKDWYDARQKTHEKEPWTPEGLALMARLEARLTLQGARHINKALLPKMGGRSLDAIKGQRKQAGYKALVAQALEEMRTPEAAALPPNPDPVDEDRSQHSPTVRTDYEMARERVQGHLRGLPACESADYNSERLDAIIESLSEWNRARVFEEMSLYLRETFRKPPRARGVRPPPGNRANQSRRKTRRADYARVQKAWKRNRTTCIRDILRDKRTQSAPPEEVMVPFWDRIMTSGGTATPGVATHGEEIGELWEPVTIKEVKAALPPLGTAPGPDSLTVEEFRQVPMGIWTRVFNILMLCGKLPDYLLESKTTLIPKKNGAAEPGEFRPITVSSAIVRAFHKVLANRMSKHIRLDPRQKAFQPIDGCSENIFLIDFVLKYARQNHKPLFMASLDVAKAFDSVTHNAILDILRSSGVPVPMIEYVAEVYRGSSTKLQSGSWTSQAIHPNCGVKQGDPLSPMLFNMVIDRLFSLLPKETGIRIGETVVNAMGYADDLVLLATTKVGLQELLDITAEYLQSCGLLVNASKCFTVALRTVPKEKKTVIDARERFRCLGRLIPALKRSDDWKYLGVPFTPEGRLMCNPLDRLKTEIEHLRAAPLKPQQRLFALRTMVIPGLYHLLVLGATNISLLTKLDVAIRGTVRKYLDLPHDVPNAYFHADVKDGGLSIPSFRWIAPLQRYHRLKGLTTTAGETGPDAMKRFLEMEIKRDERRLNDHGVSIKTRAAYKARFAKLLYQSNDGCPLKRSRGVEQQHAWLTDGTLFVSGRNFIHMNKLRINAVPLRSRMARGRVRDKQCRAGCNNAETLHHVLQQCYRTHNARIQRHDACLKYLLDRQRTQALVDEEPHFRTASGLLKPDAVIKKGNSAIVVDALIAGERANLDQEHRGKIDKYAVLGDEVKVRYSVEEVVFTSLTLSSRGVWSKRSFEHLTSLKLLNKADAKILSTRALVGGLHAINIFNRRTDVRRRVRV